MVCGCCGGFLACSVDSGLTERPWVQLQLTLIYSFYDTILFAIKLFQWNSARNEGSFNTYFKNYLQLWVSYPRSDSVKIFQRVLKYFWPFEVTWLLLANQNAWIWALRKSILKWFEWSTQKLIFCWNNFKDERDRNFGRDRQTSARKRLEAAKKDEQQQGRKTRSRKFG